MSTTFVHLHLHSEYSLVDSTLKLKNLVERVRELGMPAVAVTDQYNLFALVKFYQAAEAAGIVEKLERGDTVVFHECTSRDGTMLRERRFRLSPRYWVNRPFECDKGP